MVRHCVIEGCGRRLRTGNKYCHIHRSEGRYGKKKEDYGDGGAWFFLLLLGGIAVYLIYKLFEIIINFVYSHWIIILILLVSLLGFEIWRISKTGIKNISKFEQVIFAILITLIFMFIVIILS